MALSKAAVAASSVESDNRGALSNAAGEGGALRRMKRAWRSPSSNAAGGGGAVRRNTTASASAPGKGGAFRWGRTAQRSAPATAAASRGRVRWWKISPHDDSVNFLNSVKEELASYPRLIAEFWELMEDYLARRFESLADIASRAARIFRGYPNLILGFNRFLPGEFKIAPHIANKGGSARADTIAYLKLMKEVIKDDREKQARVAKLLRDYWTLRIDAAELVAGMTDTLRDHPELLLGYKQFLPKGFRLQ